MITFETWADYLRNHPDADLYNKNAKSIADLHDHSMDPVETFTRVSESPTLIVLLGNPIEDGFQAIFNLYTTGNDLLKKSKNFNALMGFGKKAIPIRVDPKLLFKFSSAERPVPTFRDLIMVKSTEEVKNLEKERSRRKFQTMPSYLQNSQRHY